MRRPTTFPTLARLLFALALVPALLTGCNGADSAEDAEAVRQQEWAELQEAKQALDAERQELARMVEQAEAQDAEAPGEGDTAGEASTPADIERKRNQIEQDATAFYERLVAFINADPPVAGEPMTELQQAAIRMKSDEDMRVAEEYITLGGDYSRAIGIYQDALAVDPENEELQAALARAEEERYMTQERFSQVKKGMTEAQVREVLGQPLHTNVRSYDEGVVAWFYRRDEAGSAAAVWFRPKNGQLQVYEVDFEASQAG